MNINRERRRPGRLSCNRPSQVRGTAYGRKGCLYMKRIGLYLCLGAVLIFLLVCPSEAMSAAAKGLELCTRAVIPSLFPFFILSFLLIRTGFLSAVFRPAQPLFCRLFGLSPGGAGAFFMGACAGYPIGAKSVVELTESNQISKEEGRRLLAFCNNAGPLFLVGTVGVGMFHNAACGYLLLVSHLTAAVIIGILFRRRGQHCQVVSPPAPALSWNLLSDAVSSAVNSMLAVCGYIILFQVIICGCVKSGLISCLTVALTAGRGSRLVQGILCGLIEMTTGVHILAGLPQIPMRTVLTAVSGVLGFGGLCVHAQTLGILKGYPKKTYLTGKLLQGMFSPILTYLLYPKFLPVQTVFYTHVPTQQELNGQLYLTLALLAVTIIFYLIFLTVSYFRSKQ